MCDCLSYESEDGESRYVCEVCLQILADGLGKIASKDPHPEYVARDLYAMIFEEYHTSDDRYKP